MLLLVAAALVAAVAGFATFSYLNGAQDRAYANARRIDVFVIAKDIPKGMSGDEALHPESKYIVIKKIPQEIRPASALTDTSVIRGKLAATNLAAGQVLVDGQFVDKDVAQVTSAERVPDGRVAITVQVDQVHGVAGLVMPGDKVDILTKDDQSKSMRFLYQNVEVLYVGTTPAPAVGDTTTATTAPAADAAAATGGNGLITFAVPPAAAQRIATAADVNGGLYLALVHPDNKPVPVPALTPADLFGGGLTPYES